MDNGVMVYTSSGMTFLARDAEWFDDGTVRLAGVFYLEGIGDSVPAIELLFRGSSLIKYSVSGPAESVTVMDAIISAPLCSAARRILDSENRLTAVRNNREDERE